MGIDLNKGFEELLRHRGHIVGLAWYGIKGATSDLDEVWQMAIECEDCGEVLISFDNPEMEEKLNAI